MKKIITAIILIYTITYLTGVEVICGQQDNHKASIIEVLGHQEDKSANDQATGYFCNKLQMNTTIQPFIGNSTSQDFAPFVWHNILFITSSRKTSIKQTSPPESEPSFFDIFAFVEYSFPFDPDFLPASVNTKMNDGPVAISRDTSILLVTRNYRNPNRSSVYNLYLDSYTKEKNKWKRNDFPFNNINFSLQHPFFYDAANALYFSSDMPGGYGGFDLYKSVWDGEKWGQPENLGPEINSEYDEVFPYVSPGDIIYYSSNHDETTGGLDLVMFKDSVRYLMPEPFNTVSDDFSITFINDSTGYIASNRDNSSRVDNIYYFEISCQDADDTEIIADTVITTPQEEEVLPPEVVEEKEEEVLPPVAVEKVEEVIISPAYYIIIGSSTDLDYIEKETKRLNNLHRVNSIILPPSPGGYYRISYGKYNSSEEAVEVLRYVRDNIRSDAWVLKK